MFRNIVSPCWGQEWTSSCHLPTSHMHTLRTACLCLRSALVGWGCGLGSNCCENSWEGAVWGLAGGPPPCSGAAFKLRFLPSSSPGLCCKWADTWPYTLLSWALTLTQIFDLLVWSQDLSPHCGPAWEPWTVGWLWVPSSDPLCASSTGAMGWRPLSLRSLSLPPPSTPPLQDSPCLLLLGLWYHARFISDAYLNTSNLSIT